MKKFLRIPISFDADIVGTQEGVHIHVPPEALKDFTLCLALLLHGCVESIVVATDRGNLELRISGEVGWKRSEPNRLIIMLTTTALDFATAFFMQYYRDGVAEVNHIDIETPDGDYITFAVDQVLPPVSAEEVKRRLGLT